MNEVKIINPMISLAERAIRINMVILIVIVTIWAMIDYA